MVNRILAGLPLSRLATEQIQMPGLFGRGGRGGAPGAGGRGGAGRGGFGPQAIQTFLKAEKPALVIQISNNGDGGTLFGGGQSRDAKDNLPTVVMAAEHYNRIARYSTPPRSQTGLFVPEWEELFVAAPAQGEQGAEIRVYRAQ